jgi:hypothetical protein
MSAPSFANISLYIPHVFANITKNRIVETFEKLRIGSINRIDFISKRSPTGNFNAVYIHFSQWYDNSASRNFQERVLNQNMEARIVYDEPWFWIVLENKNHKAGDRKRSVNLDALNNSQIASQDVIKPMMTNQDFANLLQKSYSEERCFAQEDAAVITLEDVLDENRKLTEQLRVYMEKSGRLEHQFNILFDDKLCLQNELALLKEDCVYNNL